jgi:hypothetical protein
MKITRIYAGPDGISHFQDIEVPFQDFDAADRRSKKIKVSGIIFRETSAAYDLDYHNPPERQYVITLDGYVDIIAGDGTKRRFGPGDIMLAEDTTGKGHISRAVNDKPRKCIFVTLD